MTPTENGQRETENELPRIRLTHRLPRLRLRLRGAQLRTIETPDPAARQDRDSLLAYVQGLPNTLSADDQANAEAAAEHAEDSVD